MRAAGPQARGLGLGRQLGLLGALEAGALGTVALGATVAAGATTAAAGTTGSATTTTGTTSATTGSTPAVAAGLALAALGLLGVVPGRRGRSTDELDDVASAFFFSVGGRTATIVTPSMS